MSKPRPVRGKPGIMWTYEQWIKSPEWRWIRNRHARACVDKQCECCRQAPGVDVHHLRYPPVWGDETPDDLAFACVECHENRHRIAVAQ